MRDVEALQPQRAQAAPRQVIAGGGAHTADADDDRVVDPWTNLPPFVAIVSLPLRVTARPAAPTSRMRCLAASITASRASPRTARASVSWPGAFALRRSVSMKTRCSAVDRFTLRMPASIARASVSSSTPDEPCMTSAASTWRARSAIRSTSSTAPVSVMPCTVPMATARASTPVSATNRSASSGSVRLDQQVLVAHVTDLPQLGLGGRPSRVRGGDDVTRAADILGVGEIGSVVHHRRESRVERSLTLRQIRDHGRGAGPPGPARSRPGPRQRRQRAQSGVRDRTRADLNDDRRPLDLGRAQGRLQHLQVEDIERRHRVAAGASRGETSRPLVRAIRASPPIGAPPRVVSYRRHARHLLTGDRRAR